MAYIGLRFTDAPFAYYWKVEPPRIDRSKRHRLHFSAMFDEDLSGPMK
jgi:hypothetical protein